MLQKDTFKLEDSDDEDSFVAPKSALYSSWTHNLQFSNMNDQFFLAPEEEN